MSQPNAVNIVRATGQLKRTEPTDDAVVCIVLSGIAEGSVSLGEPVQIFSTDELADIGLTAATNPLAYQEILDFYAKAGEGAELNFMLVVNTTSLANICDVANDLGKKLLDSVDGRGVIFLANVLRDLAYVAVIADGLDSDVNTAITKLNEMAVAYQSQNIPFVAVLPALGFSALTIADMIDRSTLANDYVALNAWCNNRDGIISMGQLAGWLVKHQVHQNIGRVKSGKVSDTGLMPDGTDAKELKYQWNALAGKGLLFPIKIGAKSGYFYKDDPTLTAISSDYSSISWNRVINKAQRIAYDVLVEKVNDDVDENASTGKIESTLASDWESDVENAIRAQMMVIKKGITQKEISGVKCTVDPDSDIVNDQVNASLTIVRKGQAKQINVSIGYGVSI